MTGHGNVMSPGVVNLEVRDPHGAHVAVIGPIPWHWELPRRGDVVRWGHPASQSADVDHVRFDLDAGQVTIVCEGWQQ